jgi:imidazolonepropionase
MIAPGSVGDLVILDAPSPAHIPYRPGTNLIWKTVKGGTVVTGRG